MKRRTAAIVAVSGLAGAAVVGRYYFGMTCAAPPVPAETRTLAAARAEASGSAATPDRAERVRRARALLTGKGHAEGLPVVATDPDREFAYSLRNSLAAVSPARPSTLPPPPIHPISREPSRPSLSEF